MVISQLISGTPLLEVVFAVNRFFTEKLVGEKYATVLLARLRSDGDLEYVNCGHVQPLLVCGGEVIRPSHGNVPVGLLPDATFESDHCQLHLRGSLYSCDGWRDRSGECHGATFFEDFLAKSGGNQGPHAGREFSRPRSIRSFAREIRLNDDCTVVELVYSSAGAQDNL